MKYVQVDDLTTNYDETKELIDSVMNETVLYSIIRKKKKKIIR